YAMGEVFINSTGEKVAYGIIKATGTKSTMEIYNLGAAANGVYNMAVNVPARNQAMMLFMTGDFPAVNYYEANMANAMSMATGFDVGGSTNPPSIAGMVNDANFSPLEGARVRLEKTICTGNPPNSVCNTVFNKENLTDVSGRYSFYDVPIATYTASFMSEQDNYNLNVGKAGYESRGDRFALARPMPPALPAPMIRDFQLALATYTLTGVLKYNSIPLPNAMIMVHPDWQGYSQGADSYRFCQYGGCGVRADARVRTGADGSFTVAGMTDGNARIEASFEGGWRSLNDGNPDIFNDNLRITISSQGARGPDTPVNNPCRPGRVWIINSSGTCVTAGSVVFNIVPENANTAGLLRGNLTFITTYTVTELEPLEISTASPLTLMAQQSCQNGCSNSQMGFTSLAGTFTSNTTTYAIVLSTGVTYYPRVFSASWAKATSFDSEVSPTEEDPVVEQNMSVVRAGGLRGVVKFPDGSNFKPVWGDQNSTTTYSGNIELRGVNVDVSEGKSPDENGEFEFTNLAPGTYKLSMRPQGGGFVWAPPALDSVSVTEGRTTEVKLQLEGGLAVKPQIYGLPVISTPTWGYFIIGVESGEEMTQKKITDLFFSEPKYSFDYSTTTGWKAKYMPSGQYDFYLMMGSKYDPCNSGDCTPSYNQFANFIGRIKGMAVQRDPLNPGIGTAAQPIAINILGSVGQAQIAGTVQGAKIFTVPDLERMFANFNEMFPLIPAILLYDTAGDLRGFANAMPNALAFPDFEIQLKASNAQGLLDYLKDNPMDYGIWGLPPGRYTAVFANPNYPPVAKDVILPDNASYIFNFDNQQVISGAISGVVRSSATGDLLGGARVYLKHRTVEKFTLTDSSGAFSISNLPAGIYRLEVSRNGYVTVGEKTGLGGNDSAAFSMYLLPSESLLSGRLFVSKFPAPITKAGVRLVAYDETLNVESPGAYLPKTEVQTDASGNYEITGVIPGHLYKLSAFYQGKLPEVLEVTAREGNTVINDITLKDTPPQITIKVKKSADSVSKVDVLIKSPKQLISIPSCQYNPGQTYNAASAVTLALVPGPGNTYLGQFTVSSNQQYYLVKVTAGDGSNKMVKEFVYDQVSNAKTEQYIQAESLAGGEVQMDKETEEYSGIELDPGALTYSTATTGAVDYSNLVGGFFSALPSVRTVKTAKGNLSVSNAIQSLMASEIYNMDLSNASANKPFTLTLKYDKEKGAGNQNLRIYQYDDATGAWMEIPGKYTVDPMTGVVSVDVGGLTNAYSGIDDVTTPLGRKRFGMSAVVKGRFVPSAAPAVQSGRFAVFTANPP
ncbi:MAG: carboxypeptidase regulatory-like domain-containing protein, partial [Elusimicrobiota bacterium]|nr:carboxypeptidase regulatory-like domain-containing protein [Elusimicrobiota bacterium]